MAAAALLIQVLLPHILAFDVTALAADEGRHARHVAAPAQPDPVPAQADTHSHMGCPLCLALHAANGLLAAALDRMPPRPSPGCTIAAAAIYPAPSATNPASYLSRAPPALL